MIQPPFQLPDGESLGVRPVSNPISPERGFPLVWIAIGGLLALMAAGALFAIVKPPGLKGDQLKIHRALSQAESAWGLLPTGPDKEDTEKIISELESLDVSSPAAKGTLARVLLILKQRQDPSTTADLDGLTDIKGESKDALTPGAETTKDIVDLNLALSELYGGIDLSEEDGERLATQLAKNEPRWPMDLAIARARAVGRSDEPDKSDRTARMATIGIVGFAALMIGAICLALAAFKPKPLGLPIDGSKADGDRLGLRFLLFLAALLGIGVFLAGVMMAYPDITQSALMLVSTLAMAVIVVLIVWLPLGGKQFTLKQIGFRSEHLGKDILYGFIAFFANLPAVVALALFGTLFLKWIPSGGHPIQSELLNISQLPLLVLAAGPLTSFVEEMAFRGMLFQGLALRMRLWPAIVLSSLGFAMIHPQGGALWLALAWIGGMAAYLTYQRKSLIPAMVMHACHNSVLLVLYAYTVGSS